MLLQFYLLIQISVQSRLAQELPSHFKLNPAKQVIGMTSKEAVNEEQLETEWQYLRVTHDYLQSNPDPKYKKFIESVTSIVEIFLAKHFLVRRPKEPLKFQDGWSTEWYGFEISEHLQATEYDADLVFFINIENISGENFIAYASPQYGDVEYSNRPIFCIASFNMAYINITNPSTVKFESFVQTVLHEYIHGMGFQKDMVELFYDSATGFSYQKAAYTLEGVFHMSTPRLLAFARQYFECEELDGLKMENQGGLGTENSHFERVLVGKELMTGADILGDVLVSDFTFQFLQDTGYYRLAEYNPDINLWGYKKGCGFVEEMCYGDEEYPEFCKNINSIGCSYDRGGVSICTDRDPLSDGCKYNYIESSFDCRDSTLQSQTYSYYQYFGYNSMCIDGYLSQQGVNPFGYTCYQYQCSYDGKLSIIVNNMTFSCVYAQEITTPTGYIGHLKCPENPEEFCLGDNECPNQCNYRGFCMRGLCTCLVGYSGLGCESTCLAYRRLSKCVSQCPTGTFALEEYKYCISCPGHCKVCTQYNSCEECNEGFRLHGGFCDYENVEYASIIAIFIIILI